MTNVVKNKNPQMGLERNWILAARDAGSPNWLNDAPNYKA